MVQHVQECNLNLLVYFQIYQCEAMNLLDMMFSSNLFHTHCQLEFGYRRALLSVAPC